MILSVGFFIILAIQLVDLKLIYSLLFVFILASCGEDFGHQVQGDQLTVFFTSIDDQELAENIALYWKENELVTNEQQDIQLVREGEWLRLLLIANTPTKANKIPFEERSALLKLQADLQIELNVAKLQIIVCNSSFEPIYNINE